jgi:hypothetical protein
MSTWADDGVSICPVDELVFCPLPVSKHYEHVPVVFLILCSVRDIENSVYGVAPIKTDTVSS